MRSISTLATLLLGRAVVFWAPAAKAHCPHPTFRAFALATASILLISSWTGPARATLMWEFGFTGRLNNFEGTGSFTLGGPTTADGVVAFEFSGVCGTNLGGGDNICDFDINDVFSSSWTLLDDGTVEDLMMRARASVMSSPSGSRLTEESVWGFPN